MAVMSSEHLARSGPCRLGSLLDASGKMPELLFNAFA